MVAEPETEAGSVLIRIAGEDDILAIVAQLFEFAELFPEVPADTEKITRQVFDCVTSGVIVLAESDGEVAGSIGFMPHEFWWSTKPFLAEIWFHVREPYRSSPAAVEMIKMAKDISDENGGIPLIFTVFARTRVDAKNRLLRRHLTPVGEGFTYNFEGESQDAI